ncbi:MAG: T9SS type A sorting domain-containing protein [Ignavibacteriales bacterium]|nr:MAG: T9SS type A sorting domain-containing protein [Ignavibacteriales bacterium]
MKLISFCFFLSSIQLFSQSFLNLHFSDGSYKYSAISSLQKITVNESEGLFNFYIDNDSIVSENIADINKFTIDPLPLGQPFPVELSSFNISVVGSSIQLNWRTESETNNFGFEIERTVGETSTASGWKKIGFIEGSGNSSSPREYLFTDSPPPNEYYHYRLKQIDIDGKYSYSNVIGVEFGTPIQFELEQNFPNPFNPATKINYTIPTRGLVTLKVFDILGCEISIIVNENLNPGSYTSIFDGRALPSGIYICRLTGNSVTQSIKMLLLK